MLLIEEDTLGFDCGKGPKSYPEKKRPVCRRFSTDALTGRPEAAGCQNRHLHPYISMDMSAAWKKLRFILSDRSDFHMTNNLSIVVYAFTSRALILFSVDEILLSRQVNLSTSFREPP